MPTANRTLSRSLSPIAPDVAPDEGHWLAPLDMAFEPPAPAQEFKARTPLYLSVGLLAGAVVALQIAVMRVLDLGDWAHIGALVVSLAMLGFGLAGTIMCIAKTWFERNWAGTSCVSLLLFGPLMIGGNLLAHRIDFNPSLLIIEPGQRWRLLATFMLYMLPVLAGAFFLGTVFLKARRVFGRVYFADLSGSGLCGLLFLGAMHFLPPHHFLLVPLLLWLIGSGLWFFTTGNSRAMAWIGVVAMACAALYLALPPAGTSPLPSVELSAHLDRPLVDGRTLAWTVLAIACIAALSLVLLPLAYGWRAILSGNPGTFRTILHFACLGAGYIMVEVGLISRFTQALGDPAASAAVLITGMLVSSGFGSLASERYLEHARQVMPKLLLAIGALLIGYALTLDRALDWIMPLPYALRLLLCFALIFPPAFLMGFPMPIAMSALSRLGKDHMFLWAWGVNGCFSVVGAALVPVIAASLGLTAVLLASGCAYLLAFLGFFAILLPATRRSAAYRPT